jgi:hypothetical protein
MCKPSAKICAIEPVAANEGYRLQYNGAAKQKKGRYTMYTECTTETSPTLILFDDGLYVVTYPGGDTLQREPDGSYLHVDSKGRKTGRTANGDDDVDRIPSLTGRVPTDINEKWIGSHKEDVSPEQVAVDKSVEVFCDLAQPGASGRGQGGGGGRRRRRGGGRTRRGRGGGVVYVCVCVCGGCADADQRDCARPHSGFSSPRVKMARPCIRLHRTTSPSVDVESTNQPTDRPTNRPTTRRRVRQRGRGRGGDAGPAGQAVQHTRQQGRAALLRRPVRLACTTSC